MDPSFEHYGWRASEKQRKGPIHDAKLDPLARLPTPKEKKPDIPDDLNTIILKCLQHDPTCRFQSMAELVKDLERYLSGKRIKTRPDSPWRRISFQAKRFPLHAAAALFLAVAVPSLCIWAIDESADNRNLAAERNVVRQKNDDLVEANIQLTSARQKVEETNAQLVNTNSELERSLDAEAAARDAAERTLHVHLVQTAGQHTRDGNFSPAIKL